MLCFPSYFKRLLRQPKLHCIKLLLSERHGGSVGVWGLSLSRCHSSVAFLSLFPCLSLPTLSPLQNISLGWSCNKIPVHTPNPLCLSNHPSPSFPLSSLKSLHSSRQLSSGKRLAFWGRGSRAALMRRRCRVLCACVYMWKGLGLRAAFGQETAPSRWWNWSFICLRAGVGWRGPCSVRRNPQTHSIKPLRAHLWTVLKGEWAPMKSV